MDESLESLKRIHEVEALMNNKTEWDQLGVVRLYVVINLFVFFTITLFKRKGDIKKNLNCNKMNDNANLI